MTTPTLPRQQFWSQHIDAWRSSGLSQAAYCREHQLRPNQLTYWKRRLFTPPEVAQSQSNTPHSTFVPLSLNTAEPTAGGLKLRLPNGFELEGIEQRHLPMVAQLLAVLP